jgi:hypothetical protein
MAITAIPASSLHRIARRELETVAYGSGIDASHFFIQDDVRADTPVLFAVARRPRTPLSRAPDGQSDAKTMRVSP